MFGHNGLSVIVPSAAIEEKNPSAWRWRKKWPCGRCLCSSSLLVLINALSVSLLHILNVTVIKLFLNALKQALSRYHSEIDCVGSFTTLSFKMTDHVDVMTQPMVCTEAKSLDFDPCSSQCGHQVLYQKPYLLRHSWLCCARARATALPLRSNSTTHSPSPWDPSRSSSESSAQQRVRRGERGAGRAVHSGFKAPSPRPLSCLSWQFPPSTWPVSTLNPSRSMWIFGYTHTCHLSAGFFFWSWMSNFVRSQCCVSSHSAWKFLLCVSRGCVYLKQPTWLCLPIFLHH